MKFALPIFLTLTGIVVVVSVVFFGQQRIINDPAAVAVVEDQAGHADRSIAASAPTHLKQASASSIQNTLASDEGTPQPSVRLSNELFAAKDWRAYVMSAKDRPEEGGYFYAIYATSLCGMRVAYMPNLMADSVKKAIERTSTVSATHLKLMEEFGSRCASFAGSESTEIYNNVRRLAADRRDPILNAVQDLSLSLKDGNVDAKKRALDALLKLDDPLALSHELLLARVMNSVPEAKKVDGLWFNGKVYANDENESRSILDIALSMAACRSSARCELDEIIMLSCLGGQFCSDDRVAYLKNRFVGEAGLSNDQFAQAIALAEEVRTAVKQRQISAFIP